MNDKEKKAIGMCRLLLNGDITLHVIDDDGGTAYAGTVNKTYNDDLETILNLIENQKAELEKKDKEIEKLKKDNKELLRKLRNRVKEVNKLTKYSLYKKEFSTLNKQLEKKDKVINEMAEKIVGFIGTCPNDNEYTLLDIDCEKVCEDNMKQCWIEYFTNKVEREGK